MNKIIVEKNTQVDTINKALLLLDINDCNEILVKPGIYFEKVKIKCNNVSIYGEDADNTIISYNDFAKKIHKDGKEYNTFRTYTVMILGDNIEIKNLTIENTSGNSAKYGQCVALETIGDKITINNCKLYSTQDTLFLGPLPKDLIIRYKGFLPDDELIYPINHRVIIKNTIIEGDVDFVFGCANAYFEECSFISLNRPGYVFAPSTEEDEFYGFTINKCVFKGINIKSKSYLARPWRDYGKVVILNSFFDDNIIDEGFNKWNDTNRDRTCRFYEYNNFYFDFHEYKRCDFCINLTDEEIDVYDVKKVFGDKR